MISREGAGGELWVIAARNGAGTEPVTISGLPSTVTNGSVYTEGRSIAAPAARSRTRSPSGTSTSIDSTHRRLHRLLLRPLRHRRRTAPTTRGATHARHDTAEHALEGDTTPQDESAPRAIPIRIHGAALGIPVQARPAALDCVPLAAGLQPAEAGLARLPRAGARLRGQRRPDTRRAHPGGFARALSLNTP